MARMGGEEFVMVRPGMPVSEATARLEVVRRALRSYGWDDITQGLPITVSIGVAGFSDAPSSTQRSLSIAERNLYVAKHAGRDRVISMRRATAVPGPTATAPPPLDRRSA
jgi:diguanylate cyclase (GGDEF)-like protein